MTTRILLQKPQISSFKVKMLTRNAEVNFLQPAVTASSDHRQPSVQHQGLMNRCAVNFLAWSIVKGGSQVKSDLQKRVKLEIPMLIYLLNFPF